MSSTAWASAQRSRGCAGAAHTSAVAAGLRKADTPIRASDRSTTATVWSAEVCVATLPSCAAERARGECAPCQCCAGRRSHRKPRSTTPQARIPRRRTPHRNQSVLQPWWLRQPPRGRARYAAPTRPKLRPTTWQRCPLHVRTPSPGTGWTRQPRRPLLGAALQTQRWPDGQPGGDEPRTNRSARAITDANTPCDTTSLHLKRGGWARGGLQGRPEPWLAFPTHGQGSLHLAQRKPELAVGRAVNRFPAPQQLDSLHPPRSPQAWRGGVCGRGGLAAVRSFLDVLRGCGNDAPASGAMHRATSCLSRAKAHSLANGCCGTRHSCIAPGQRSHIGGASLAAHRALPAPSGERFQTDSQL